MKCFILLMVFLVILQIVTSEKAQKGLRSVEAIESFVCEERESSLVFKCNLEYTKIDMKSFLEESKLKRKCKNVILPYDVRVCKQKLLEVTRYQMIQHMKVAKICLKAIEDHKKICPDSKISLFQGDQHLTPSLIAKLIVANQKVSIKKQVQIKKEIAKTRPVIIPSKYANVQQIKILQNLAKPIVLGPNLSKIVNLQVNKVDSKLEKVPITQKKANVLENYIFGKLESSASKKDLVSLVKYLYNKREKTLQNPIINVYYGKKIQDQQKMLVGIKKLIQQKQIQKLLKSKAILKTLVASGKVSPLQKFQMKEGKINIQPIKASGRIDVQRGKQVPLSKIPVIFEQGKIIIHKLVQSIPPKKIYKVRDSLYKLLLKYIFGKLKLDVKEHEMRQFIDEVYSSKQKSIVDAKLHSILTDIISGFRPTFQMPSQSATGTLNVLPIRPPVTLNKPSTVNKQVISILKQSGLLVKPQVGLASPKQQVSLKKQVISILKQNGLLGKSQVGLASPKQQVSLKKQVISILKQNGLLAKHQVLPKQQVPIKLVKHIIVQPPKSSKPVSLEFFKHLLHSKVEVQSSVGSQNKIMSDLLSHLILDYIFGEYKPNVKKQELIAFVEGHYKDQKQFIQISKLRTILIEILLGYQPTLNFVSAHKEVEAIKPSVVPPKAKIVVSKPQVVLSKPKQKVITQLEKQKATAILAKLPPKASIPLPNIPPSPKKVKIIKQKQVAQSSSKSQKLQNSLVHLLVHYIFGQEHSKLKLQELKAFIVDCFTEEYKSVVPSRLKPILMDLMSGNKVSLTKFLSRLTLDEKQVSSKKLKLIPGSTKQSPVRILFVKGKPVLITGKPMVIKGKQVFIPSKTVFVQGKPVVVSGQPILIKSKPVLAPGKVNLAKQVTKEEYKSVVPSRLKPILMDLMSGNKVSLTKFLSRLMSTQKQVSSKKLKLIPGSTKQSPVRIVFVKGKPVLITGKPMVIKGKQVFIPTKTVFVQGKPVVVAGKPILIKSKPVLAPGKVTLAKQVAKDDFDISFIFEIVDELVQPDEAIKLVVPVAIQFKASTKTESKGSISKP